MAPGTSPLSTTVLTAELGAQGLRLGYLHSSPELLAPCNALAVDHPSVVLQYSLAELMSSGALLIACLS